MLRKPWPIVILTIFFICSPFFNMMGTYLLLDQDVSFQVYLNRLFFLKANHLYLFNMIVPDLVAGFAIWKVRKWSYPVVLCCIAWVTINSVVGKSFELDTFYLIVGVIIPTLFNFSVVSYFLIPSVKTTYYDPRVRWWDAKPRYKVNLKASTYTESNSISGVIENISEGGVFLKAESEIRNKEAINLSFETDDYNFSFLAKVIFNAPGTSNYGLQFENLSIDQKSEIKKYIKSLRKSGAELCRPIPLWSDDLKKWFFELLKTGKGLTPKVEVEKVLNK